MNIEVMGSVNIPSNVELDGTRGGYGPLITNLIWPVISRGVQGFVYILHNTQK